ncbi:hypothetical protein [Pseudoxanthomonas sacheonensis]|uniref:Uncharacterized protein n=1 Tax=Pseudoxanthomonas sacheonensis TaxID=443615 RepID=A0ABU1RXN8_9GAMM|nr:hypothetical protein [Pseudoxanthomonas sacheonensis]MDR6842690.1 hypothetical protein [Pseudoxanthomonas sacheonensis]
MIRSPAAAALCAFCAPASAATCDMQDNDGRVDAIPHLESVGRLK